jgi:hypothetical protein
MDSPRQAMNSSFRIVVAGALISLGGGAFSGGDPAIDSALSAWAKQPNPPSYEFAVEDLNADGKKDALVLLTGNFCGSGGCTLLVLQGQSEGYKVVSASTVTRKPIALLSASNFGWRTLAVTIGGGGMPSSQVLMRFNGKRYPQSLTVQIKVKQSDLKGSKILKFSQ